MTASQHGRGRGQSEFPPCVFSPCSRSRRRKPFRQHFSADFAAPTPIAPAEAVAGPGRTRWPRRTRLRCRRNVQQRYYRSISYFDAAAMAAPASFRAGIEQAASILSATITNKITVNINIDYSGTGGGAAAGPDNGQLRKLFDDQGRPDQQRHAGRYDLQCLADGVDDPGAIAGRRLECAAEAFRADCRRTTPPPTTAARLLRPTSIRACWSALRFTS